MLYVVHPVYIHRVYNIPGYLSCQSSLQCWLVKLPLICPPSILSPLPSVSVLLTLHLSVPWQCSFIYSIYFCLFFLNFHSKILCFFLLVPQKPLLPVCVMSNVAYRLSCESYMIPKNQSPCPPVTIEKLCTSPYKPPCKL